MITAADFQHLVEQLGVQAVDDISWSENLKEPLNADDFAREIIFVIANSGMKNTVARGIYYRVIESLNGGGSASAGFGHAGKTAAMDGIWKDRELLFGAYNDAPDKLTFLETLPWIGPITKYHAAKNFGVDVAKPDVHLQRLADREGCSVQFLCDRLSKEVGLRSATVDVVLWRACANGVLDSRTGVINGRSPVA